MKSVQVRITDDDYRRLKHLSSDKGVTMSSWVRSALALKSSIQCKQSSIYRQLVMSD